MNRVVKRSITLMLALVIVLALMPLPCASAAAMRQGSRGSEVTYMQLNLIGLGYLSDSADGSFGPKTAAAVKAFQADYGLSVDGIAGQATQVALRNAMIRLQVELKKMGYAPGSADGYYGEKTKSAVAAFQRDRGMTSTGAADKTTRNAIDELSGGMRSYTSIPKNSYGTQVRYMQMALIGMGFLSGSVDGHYGTKTEAAVRSFQSAYGLTVDGSAGRNTMTALKNAVVAIQSDLARQNRYKGVIDGIFGDGTRSAVKGYQSYMGLMANGIAGPSTLGKLWGFAIGVNDANGEERYLTNVKIVRQDNNFSEIRYGGSRTTTVAVSGCGGATLAMVLNTYLETDQYTAQGIMQWMADRGYYYGEGTSQEHLRYYANLKKVNSIYCDSASDLIANLKKGRLAIALVKDKTGNQFFTSATSDGHYVVVCGYQTVNGEKQVYISNPLTYKRSGWYNIDDLMNNCINEREGYPNSFVVFYK